MPTTGPFSRTESNNSFYLNRIWSRQQPPYRAPLPYKFVRKTFYKVNADNPIGSPSGFSYNPYSSPVFAEAYNKAYADFKEKVGEAASLAVNIAERKQAIDAMTKRVTQVARFAKALKSFRFGEAARALELVVVSETKTSVRVKRSNHSKNSSWDRMVQQERLKDLNRKHIPDDAPVSGQLHKKRKPRYRKEDDSWELTFKRNASHYGSNYLEFHFGWEPLMKDIQNSFDLFTNPMRDKLGLQVVGRGKATLRGAPPSNPPLFSSWTVHDWTTVCAIRARVKVKDLNLYRLEQLGLLNPAVLLWELVPFSFIADWFVNVGDFLASFTDFIGLELMFPQNVTLSKIDENDYYKRYAPSGGGVIIIVGTYSYKVVCVERKLGIGAPTIALKPLKWPSVTRGLTAVSLLTGLFSTVQPRR
jgi:hypothetical protein